jgi:Flp pilus assembly protein TadD
MWLKSSSIMDARIRFGAGMAVAALTLAAAGCAQTPKLSLSAGSLAPQSQALEMPSVPPAQKAEAEKQAVRAAMLAKAEAEPRDVRRTVAAARELKSEGRMLEALQLVERSLAVNAKDPLIIREAGLLALDVGQSAKAEKLLRKAIELGSTEWQTRSGFGVALASQGKHSEAQLQLARALEEMPDHPAILNNLALSYVLDNKPAEAEKVLRIAAAKKTAPRHVQHNLALVLGVRGKIAEAEQVATAASLPAKATANATYVKSLASARPQMGADPLASVVQEDAPIKAARAQTLAEKPYLLGVGAPKQAP